MVTKGLYLGVQKCSAKSGTIFSNHRFQNFVFIIFKPRQTGTNGRLKLYPLEISKIDCGFHICIPNVNILQNNFRKFKGDLAHNFEDMSVFIRFF